MMLPTYNGLVCVRLQLVDMSVSLLGHVEMYGSYLALCSFQTPELLIPESGVITCPIRQPDFSALCSRAISSKSSPFAKQQEE